jgi:Holliday junction DNA helicase RuvA
MIGWLTGRLVECSPGRVLLDVGGVGYELQIPLSTFYRLVPKTSASTTLHVHTRVREDSLSLYGFFSLEERTLFERLISISGVGPRMALAILSGIGVQDLHEALYRRDLGRLRKIPGVGKKTAERVMLELRDKLKLTEPDGQDEAPAPAPVDSAEGASLREDAVSALVNLGYSPAVSERAVRASLKHEGAEAPLEAVLKGALRGLAR